jgi:hypothetical protein
MTDQVIQETKVRKRPFGLYVIIGLLWLAAGSLALGLVALEVADQRLRLPVGDYPLFVILAWALAGTFMLASFGLWLLKRWGWTLTMILVGATLAYDIWQYFQGDAHFVTMAISLVIVFYLNQRDVQSPFMRRSRRGEAQ